MTARATLILMAIAAALALPSRPPARASSGSLRTITTSHGVQLTLSLPRHTYPQNALVRATVSVRNLTSHARGLLTTCQDACVEVRSTGGDLLYPPAVPATVEPKGMHGGVPLNLPAGGTITWHPLIILRGSEVRATIWLGTPGMVYRPGQHGAILHTAPLHVLLTQEEQQPAIELTTGADLQADLTPATPVRGTLRYAYSYSCTRPGDMEAGGDEWMTVTGAYFHLPLHNCDTLELHLVAGWLGHPVGILDYPPPSNGGPPDQVLGAPIGPPHLNADQARTVALAYESDIAAHPITEQFGSLDTSRFGSASVSGPIDVWKIVVTGYITPAPGPRGQPHPIFQTLAIIIEDQTGKVLFASAY